MKRQEAPTSLGIFSLREASCYVRNPNNSEAIVTERTHVGTQLIVPIQFSLTVVALDL